MQLQEYILVPMSKNIVLPYDTGKFTVNKNFAHIFFPGSKVVLGFYQDKNHENSIAVVSNLENQEKVYISRYGTIVHINKTSSIDEDSIEVTAHGLSRIILVSGKSINGTILVVGRDLMPVIGKDSYKEFNDLRLSICDIVQSGENGNNIYSVLSMEPVRFFYFVSGELSDHNFEFKIKQLQEDNIINGLKNILSEYFYLNKVFKEEVEQEIYQKFKKNLEEHQRNYMLNEQMKTIKNELDKLNPVGDSKIEKDIENHEFIPNNTKQMLLREYEKIKNVNPLSSEYSVVKNYLNLALSLPWGKSTPISNLTLTESEKIINEEHYGLDEVKENILQYLAMAIKTNQQKMKILLLLGPPGVGKTSIGNVIAKCLKRKFVFISLTSIEIADLCGHRRTYVGAYPGRIVNALIENEANNVLFFLDEIDKVNRNMFNNPLNVLVSILDPTQNQNFTDQFLSFPFDLSKCIFILTANSLENIPDYLISRMEIVQIDGYTIEEKVEIASRFLIPKIYKEYDIKKKEISCDEKALEYVIKHYTREMGVRKLQQLLNNLIMKVTYLNMKAKEEKKERKNCKVIKEINNSNITNLVDAVPLDFSVELNPCEAIGMAWTSVGGDILKIQALFINSGKGDVTITGNLGKVMQESVQVAFNLLKNSSILKNIKIADDFFSKHSLHIHVPEGAVPKDGPSAGITIYTAIMSGLISTVTGKNYSVPMISMTGEISLSMPGEVLAIGGLKQKMLAALNYGIKEVIVPEANRLSVEKMKNFPFHLIKINYVKYINQVEEIMFKSMFKSFIKSK